MSAHPLLAAGARIDVEGFDEDDCAGQRRAEDE